ncbi:MAG: hypothetical protein A2V90_10000 [Gammaproteobacteria bacterium RBG_16_57_12]|nr:MAG: hypothetical protein A2V90_10000 [Gammaproteobacteria bacterium RBG_16_57_12]
MMIFSSLRERLRHWIWDADLRTLSGARALPFRILRISHLIYRDLADGQLTLRSMSLVYTTLLSLIPLLAISFSVLKGFGMHNRFAPLLLDILSPLGDKSVEITGYIIRFVEHIRADILGSVGLAFLIYTVISMVQKVEQAFNYTWHIKRHRPIMQRFSNYLSVILVGPVLIFSALGIMVSLLASDLMQQTIAIRPFGILLTWLAYLLPYLLIIGAFTFFYILIPNTRVRFHSALVGATIAGIAWKTIGWAFATFLVNSPAYLAIYSTFAILILFMIWLYISWLILLLGASIAFYHQHPEFIRLGGRSPLLSNAYQERLAFNILYLICHNYYQQQALWTLEGLARHLQLPSDIVDGVLAVLERHGFITQSGDEGENGYLPAHPPESVYLKDILMAIRQSGDTWSPGSLDQAMNEVINGLFASLDRAQEQALAGQTLKALAMSEPGRRLE